MSELKPCPFCGDEARESKIFGRAGVVCRNCTAEMRSEEICDGEVAVITAWNTRATPPGTILTKDAATWPDDRQEVILAGFENQGGFRIVCWRRQLVKSLLEYDRIIWWSIPEGMFQPPTSGESDG